MREVVVIGAGIGGLTTAALLLQAGYPVTVLEAHIYPGGSAGTFFHKGYRFDAGATLAGGFSPGGPHARLAELLQITWPVRPADPAWVTHLPGLTVPQVADRAAWKEVRQQAFPGSEDFWRLQEHLSDISWNIAAKHFPWPPASPADFTNLARALDFTTLLASPYALLKLQSLLPRQVSPDLRAFLDAQLIISAQTTTRHANALYASAALDLPRRGVNHVTGGIGALAQTLAGWITQHGGKILYRQPVERILMRDGRAVAVITRKGLEIRADILVANLTPLGLQQLLGDQAPAGLRRETRTPPPGWGAFMLYLGLDASDIPAHLEGHHQVIADPSRPLGEGNSVFFSLNDPLDTARAPANRRTATISTHTAAQPWWELFQADPQAYARRKEDYTQRVLQTLQTILPNLRESIDLLLPATPLTFQFYTRRPLGMVGGSPQTSLFRARGPHTGIPNLLLVGDSIFPGQSTAGVTLGAFRVAAEIQQTDRSRVTSTFFLHTGL